MRGLAAPESVRGGAPVRGLTAVAQDRQRWHGTSGRARPRCFLGARGPHGRLVSKEWQGAVALSPQGCALGTETSSPYGCHIPWSLQGGDLLLLKLDTILISHPGSAQRRHMQAWKKHGSIVLVLVFVSIDLVLSGTEGWVRLLLLSPGGDQKKVTGKGSGHRGSGWRLQGKRTVLRMGRPRIQVTRLLSKAQTPHLQRSSARCCGIH